MVKPFIQQSRYCSCIKDHRKEIYGDSHVINLKMSVLLMPFKVTFWSSIKVPFKKPLQVFLQHPFSLSKTQPKVSFA